MSLVDKFSGFEVKNDERISAEDKAYLEKLQEIYDGTLTFYSRVEALYNEESEKYTKDVREILGTYSAVFSNDMDVRKRVCGLQLGFINQIYAYFRDKYKLIINDNREKEERKYDSYKFYKDVPKEVISELYERRSYKPIVDDILSQLGGMTFDELSVLQIKDRMKKASFYYDKWWIELKNNTIKCDSVYVSKAWYDEKYTISRNEFMAVLPDALGLFIEGRSESPYLSFMRKYSIELTEEEMKNGITFPDGLKLKSIKFYKKGRMDLKFEKAEYAREFAREYCGYTMV